MSEVTGIFQSDVLIRAALVYGLEDLRSNPWKLQDVFAGLPQDARTAAIYGEKERARATEWFTKHDIPVVMDYQLDPLQHQFCVTIGLVDSNEAEATLGDTHYVTVEDAPDAWVALTAPFAAPHYNAATGLLRLPATLADTLQPTTAMAVVDRAGRAYPILDVPDDVTVMLAPGSPVDPTRCYLRAQATRQVQTLESVQARESYRIGCHVVGEPAVLTWLHSIVYYVLLHHKEELLEARGFERSVVTTAPFAKNDASGRENWWSRYINVVGYARQTWAKRRQTRPLGVGGQLGVGRLDDAVEAYGPQDNYDAETTPWLGEDDA